LEKEKLKQLRIVFETILKSYPKDFKDYDIRILTDLLLREVKIRIK